MELLFFFLTLLFLFAGAMLEMSTQSIKGLSHLVKLKEVCSVCV